MAPMGMMERMIQFKEKSAKQSDSASLELLSYPVLQAADILLYKTELVPIGVDLGGRRIIKKELARRFNNKYKEIFPEPKTLHAQTKKVVGLDGKSKMSKSYNNYIGLDESKEKVWEKIAPAVTDPARVTKNDPGNPEICNIYSLHKLISSEQDLKWSAEGCANATIGCIECKRKLYENLETVLGPIRESYQEWINKKDDLKEILEQGAKKSNSVANQTIKEVYDLVGFRY
jgi:tryptophanyl-tRNA synthetase